MKERIPKGTRIYFDVNGYTGYGTVVGLSVEHIISFYIIQPDPEYLPDQSVYAYDVFVAPDSSLTILTD